MDARKWRDRERRFNLVALLPIAAITVGLVSARGMLVTKTPTENFRARGQSLRPGDSLQKRSNMQEEIIGIIQHPKERLHLQKFTETPKTRQGGPEARKRLTTGDGLAFCIGHVKTGERLITG
jgi:hypothetical protein